MPYDVDTLFPDSEFLHIPSVPVFKTHSKIKGGKRVVVTKDDLDQIAKNQNDEFDSLGVAVPLTLGHTRESADGSDLAETDQPEIVGWSANYSTGKLPNGEDALYCDWFVRKEHSDVIRRFPTRSVEYYINRKNIWPIALLKSSAPELTLPILKYKYGKELQPNEEPPIQFTLTSHISYSTSTNPTSTSEKDPMPEDKDKKPTDTKTDYDAKDDTAKEKAVDNERKGPKEDGSKVADLESKVNSLMEMMTKFAPMMEQLSTILNEGDGENDDDLMKPTEEPKPEPKPTDAQPVKFDAASPMGSMPSPTNVCPPSFTKDKDQYKMTDEEVIKFRKEREEFAAKYTALETEIALVKKVNTDLYKKSRRADAEKLVYRLENEFHIIFPTPEQKEKDTTILTDIDSKFINEHFDRIKLCYQKRTPNSESVKEVNKYAAEGEPTLQKLDPAQIQSLSDKIVASGLPYDQALAQLTAKK